MFRVFAVSLAILLLTACQPSGSDADIQADKIAIEQTLRDQTNAWNRGDIDGFMQDYWQSEDLRFASGDTVKRGWATTLARYKTRYPDQATMGQLSFSDLDIDVFHSDQTSDNALVFGRWTLTRDADSPTGLFTLHMRRVDQRWIIISDHTSSAQ